LLCAIYLGLIQTLFIGGLLYVAALVIVLRLGSRARVEQNSAPRQVIATRAFD
jgi:hypothetical protein